MYSMSWVRSIAVYWLKFGGLEFFGVFGHDEVVDTVLDVTVDKGLKIIDSVVDAMIGDASLRIIIGAYLGRTVAGANEGLAS